MVRLASSLFPFTFIFYLFRANEKKISFGTVRTEIALHFMKYVDFIRNGGQLTDVYTVDVCI